MVSLLLELCNTCDAQLFKSNEGWKCPNCDKEIIMLRHADKKLYPYEDVYNLGVVSPHRCAELV